MKIVDIVILLILVLGAFRGFQKGLLLEVIGLVAFFLGIWGGFRLMPLGVDFLERFLDFKGLLPFISFIIIFIGIVLAVNLLGMVLKKTIDMTILGSFDDLAGSLAGVLKWAISISFLIWLLGFFNFSLGVEYTEGAVIYPFIASLAPWLIETISTVMPFVKEFFDTVEKQASPPVRQAFLDKIPA